MAEQQRPQQNNKSGETAPQQPGVHTGSEQYERKTSGEEEAPRPDTTESPTPEQNGVVQRLRTYRDDVARAMKQKGTSAASIATAEAQKRRGKNVGSEVSGTNRRTLVKVAASIALVLLGIGAVVAGVFFLSGDDTERPETTISVPSFFFVDDEIELDATDADEDALRQVIHEEIDRIGLPLGSMAQIYLTRQTTLQRSGETIEVKQVLGSDDFFAAIDAEVPSSLPRALANDFMLGGHVFDGTQPFIVFRVNSYEQAFAGMLEWEESMSRDLSPIFGPEVTSVSTGTSTLPRARVFRDEVVRNQDARVLYRTSGNPAILYVFPSRTTLVITTNENTLAEVLTRIANARR